MNEVPIIVAPELDTRVIPENSLADTLAEQMPCSLGILAAQDFLWHV